MLVPLEVSRDDFSKDLQGPARSSHGQFEYWVVSPVGCRSDLPVFPLIRNRSNWVFRKLGLMETDLIRLIDVVSTR